MNDTLFRILTAILLVVGAAISIYFRSKAERERAEKLSLKPEGLAITLSLRLFGLSLWLAVFAYLIQPAWIAWSRVDLPEWLRWVGLGMGALANILSFWVFSSLGNNVSPTVVTRSNHQLVTDGPYRWVRHPLYSMGMIAYLGISLVAESWFMALMAVLVFIVLVMRLPKEEAHLIKQFGDEYRAYMRRTGKFLPKL